MSDKKNKPISTFFIYILFLLMIITGSINTIANKLQNIEYSLGKSYNHVWFITFCMFLGEITCFLWYFLSVLYEKRQQQKNKEMYSAIINDSSKNEALSNIDTQERSDEILPLNGNEIDSQLEKEIQEISPFLLAIPAFCDFFGTTIMTFGLTMMASSVYQMFRGSLILITAVFSVIFLKNKLFRHHYLGLFIVVSGLLMVGAASLFFKIVLPPECGAEEAKSNSSLGIILVIASQFFSAAQFIVEEKFMKQYKCHPLKAIGWEGVWGSLLYLIILICFQFIPCPTPQEGEQSFTKYICSENDKGEWRLEDTIFAFRQLGNNGFLLFFCLLYIFSIAIFNFVGISVTKYASSPARAVIDTIRTIVVWAFFLLPIVSVCNREHFLWLQLAGFVCLILGTIVFNEIWVPKWFNMDIHTKKYLENKTNNEDSIEN